MKTIIAVLSLAVLAIPAEAAKPGQAPKITKRDRQEEKKEEKEREARKRHAEAVHKFLEEKDANKDGTGTRDEYLLGEADKEAAGKKFDEANKNGDRQLSRNEIEALLGFKD